MCKENEHMVGPTKVESYPCLAVWDTRWKREADEWTIEWEFVYVDDMEDILQEKAVKAFNVAIDFYTSATCPTKGEAKEVFIKELNQI